MILGAGASYDSDPFWSATGELDPSGMLHGFQPSMGLRPPLARDLFVARDDFGNLIDTYPEVRALVPNLRRSSLDPALSIERQFERIVSEAADRAETARQLVALRFYLRAAVERATTQWALTEAHGVTNYHLLVNRLDIWSNATNTSVGYLTFNYDTLLEVALSDVLGHVFDTMESYIAQPACRVFKLHGSVNWRRLLADVPFPAGSPGPFGPPSLDFETWVIRRSSAGVVTPTFEVGPTDDLSSSGQFCLPAVAVPTETKTEGTFELPEDHLETLRTLIPLVTRVLVIGWRGREEHFWRFWAACHPHSEELQVEVVDSDQAEAQKVAEVIATASMCPNVHPSPATGFTDYVFLHPEVSHLLA